MKKLVLILLSFLACGTLYSLPIGNPADASLLCDGLICEPRYCDPCDPCFSWRDVWSIRFGFYGDYNFNRHMELDVNETQHDIEDVTLFTNSGFLALNFWDRIDIFGVLGTTNMFINTDASAFGLASGSRLDIEMNTHFSWSVGGRATLWQCGCTYFGVEAQYFHTRPHVTRITLASSQTVFPNNHFDAKYHEGQIGMGISHRISMLVPYVAIKWSHAKLIVDRAPFPQFLPTLQLKNLETKKHFGYAIGVSLIDCELASFTVEGRFLDEKALYVNGQIRF